jgi:hypothetical protein
MAVATGFPAGGPFGPDLIMDMRAQGRGVLTDITVTALIGDLMPTGRREVPAS